MYMHAYEYRLTKGQFYNLAVFMTSIAIFSLAAQRMSDTKHALGL